VLAISGGGCYLHRREALKPVEGFGAAGAIMKPFNCEQLLHAIDGARDGFTAPPS
jgi:hypothetical protein